MGMGAGLCFPQEVGKREASLSAYLTADWFTHLICPAGCWPSLEPRQVWQKCPWSCKRGYGCKATWRVTLGRAGGKNYRGTATSGRQRGAVVLGVLLCASAVFTDAPLCPGPRGCSTEQVDRPQTGLCLSRL